MRVKFLPKKDINVEICNIYEDKEAVIIQSTDTLQSNTAFNCEALSFKYGIKPTVYHYPYANIQTDLKNIQDSDVLKFSIYYPTDRYRDGNESYILPDYLSNTLTQEGADFYGRTIGESKQTGYPNQGQELFDYTHGNRGYDVNNSQAGNDGNLGFINEINYIQNWFKKKFGVYSSASSDRQGKIGSKEIYMPYFMSMRRASVDNSLINAYYSDIDRLGFIYKKVNSMWESAFDKEDTSVEDNILVTAINNALMVNGMFHDFSHWHRARDGKELKLVELFDLINKTVDNRNVWYASANEACEYYWYRQMVKRVRGSFINGKLYLVADFDDEFFRDKIAGIDKQLLYDRIRQPLSVKVDLTGTILDGKDIKGGGIINLGDNKFIIDIPFNVLGNELQQVEISETTQPIYKNFTKPTVLNYNNGIITTDLPCKAVMFNGDFNAPMTYVKRFNNFSTNHDFNGFSGTKIGLITESGVSILHESL